MSESDAAVSEAPTGVAQATEAKATSSASSTPRSKRRTRQKAGQQLPRGPRGGVELLLIQSVEHLGKQGDVVEVKRGFALNYLLPQGLATIATDHHKRMVEKHRAKLEEIARQRMASLRAVLSELARTSVTIEANANDDDG